LLELDHYAEVVGHPAGFCQRRVESKICGAGPT
jgi:hypothetical protein